MVDDNYEDVCRVCRLEGNAERPLFHPCVCTGSIRYIHQECLTQWLKYSRKEYCEVCHHGFKFTPIYSADMPKHLPTFDVMSGLFWNLKKAVVCWIHYTFVAVAWLIFVPITAWRIYHLLFFMTSTDDMFQVHRFILSMDNVIFDTLQGCVVVSITMCAFISLVWLRDQILLGGGPDWLLEHEANAGNRNNGTVNDNEADLSSTDSHDSSSLSAPARILNNSSPISQPYAQHSEDMSQTSTNDDLTSRHRLFSDDTEHVSDYYDNAATSGQNTTNRADKQTETNNSNEYLLGEDSLHSVNVLDYDSNVANSSNILENPNRSIHESLEENSSNTHVDSDTQNVDENPAESDNLQEGEEIVEQVVDNEAANQEPAAEERWMPLDWERAADDLTWERLLGLDGSLIFLEHVFWVVLLNAIFIFTFAYIPFRVGHRVIVNLRLQQYISALHFDRFLTTLVGYFFISVLLVVFHWLFGQLRFKKVKRLLGVGYVVVKVSLLTLIEVFVFPLTCGWWLDVCSLQLLGASLAERREVLQRGPASFMFVHWFLALIVIFYFASLVLLLREVLRPGVLWFLRNFNDPDFNPIQEMIHLPVIRHIKRFVISIIIFGTTTIFAIWLPIRFIVYAFPTFLPYNMTFVSEGINVEPWFQLFLLQIFMPVIMEQTYIKRWLKKAIWTWCVLVSRFTGLRSYLLGDIPLHTHTKDDELIRGDSDDIDNVPSPDLQSSISASRDAVNEEPQLNAEDGLNVGENNNADIAAVPRPRIADAQPRALGAAHQAFIFRELPSGVKAYLRPRFMWFRLAVLIACMFITLSLISFAMLTIPVSVGRHFLYLLFLNTDIDSLLPRRFSMHEIYTFFCGLLVCWNVVRACVFVFDWFSLTLAEMKRRFIHLCMVCCHAAAVSFLVAGIIPFMYGCLVDMIVFVPIRVGWNQTPLVQFSQIWTLGLLYTKISGALTIMGPDWWLKQVLEQEILEGFANLNTYSVFKRLVAPIIFVLGLSLSIPYILAYNILPYLVSGKRLFILQRFIYTIIAVVLFCVVLLCYECRQLRRLYEHIRNDKYLVGRRLVNYEHQSQAEIQTLKS